MEKPSNSTKSEQPPANKEGALTPKQWHVRIGATHPKTGRQFTYETTTTMRVVSLMVLAMRLRGFGKIFIKWSRPKEDDE